MIIRATAQPYGCHALVLALALGGCASAPPVDPWQQAQRLGSIAAYENFVRNRPNDPNVRQARTRLAELRVEEDWQRARSQNTISSYSLFLNMHPESERAAEAHELGDQLLAERDWKRADSIEALERFLGAYPTSPHVPEARSRLEALGEKKAEQLWQAASSLNSIFGYEVFLREHGTSQYAAQAKQRLAVVYEEQERRLLPRLQAVAASAKELAALPVGYGDFAKNLLIQARGSLLTYQGQQVAATGIVHARIPSKGQAWIPLNRLLFRFISLGPVPQPRDVLAHTASGSTALGYVTNAFGELSVAVPREIVPFEMELQGVIRTRIRFDK